MNNSLLRPMQLEDAQMVLSWRNHDEVRRWMNNQEIINLDEHLAWFERNKDKTDRYFLIFENDGVSEGYVSFLPMSHSNAYEWGFYIRPNATKGMGVLLGKTALKYAFEQLGFHKVFGQVLSFNEKSINFHRKMGFFQEGLLREQFSDSRGTFDIYQFGLLKAEWLELNHE